MKDKAWYEVSNIDEIDSPALLIYPERVRDNIRLMIKIAGSTERLCPHVKTHKLAEITRMHLEMGITKFKAATIAEAEMCARAGATDVLLAYQPVGPKLTRFVQLTREFPKTRFSALTDNRASAEQISEAAVTACIKIPLLVDINCGMNRTGIPAGADALALYQTMASLPGLKVEGLHVYDGHIADSDPIEREKRCEAAFAPAAELRNDILKLGLPVPRLIAGGSPTFPIHARRPNVECSPGTTVLWDHGYGSRCLDLPFLHAAVVLTRVISKPTADRLCLDLGHKAIAAENPHPRVIFLNLPDAKAVSHSEEHLAVETPHAASVAIGTVVYGIPFHVCPTVALHSEAVVVENGSASARWQVESRNRRLNI